MGRRSPPRTRLHLRTRGEGEPRPRLGAGRAPRGARAKGALGGAARRPPLGVCSRGPDHAAAQTDSAPRRNLSLVKELGDRAAQGRACGNLGNTHYLLGSFVEATAFHKEVGRRRGRAGCSAPASSGLGAGVPGLLPRDSADVGPAALGGVAEPLRDHRAAGVCVHSAWPSRRSLGTRRPSAGPTATWGTPTSSWGASTWLPSTTSRRPGTQPGRAWAREAPAPRSGEPDLPAPRGRPRRAD